MVGGITRMTRTLPPSHCLFKIEAFSLLVEAKVDKYKSVGFEAGGHQWRLVLYPTGNKRSNGSGYISQYLEIEKSLGREVNAEFKLFVYDQIRDQYLIIQDTEMPVKRFSDMTTAWGISQILSQKKFNNAANGYLVDDCCTFGAEVLVIRHPLKLHKSVFLKHRPKVTMRIPNFSKLDKNCYRSPAFTTADIRWSFQIFPKGYSRGKDTHFSVFLALAEPDTQVHVRYKQRLRNQINSKHLEVLAETRFISPWMCGASKFVSLKDVYDSSKGYMVEDSLIVEVEFILISKLH